MNSPYLTLIACLFAIVLPKFFPEIHPSIRFLSWGLCGYFLWRWHVEEQKFKAELNRQFNLGCSLFQQREYRQALQAFGRILKQPSAKLKDFDKLPDTYFIRGRVFYCQQRYLKAIEDWNKTLEVISDEPEVYLYRGMAHQDLGNSHAAIKDYEATIQLDSSSCKPFYYWGHLYQSEENFELAIERYSHAIRTHQTFTEAYQLRGYCYFCLSNYERALKDVELAIQLREQGHSGLESTQEELNSLTLYSLRGLIHSSLEHHQQALKDFNSSIELEKNNVMAYLGRGIYRCHQSQYSLALSDFRKAIQLNPSAIAYYNQAVAENLLDLKDEALVSLNNALELQENMIAALYSRGYLYLSNKDELNGDADFQNAKDLEAAKPKLLDRDDAYAMFCRGFAFHRTDQRDIATESFSQALKICKKYQSKSLQEKIEATIESLSLVVAS